jgi:hypothetical protein
MQKMCSTHTSKIDSLQSHANEVASARDLAQQQLQTVQAQLTAAESRLALLDPSPKHLQELKELRQDKQQLGAKVREMQVRSEAGLSYTVCFIHDAGYVCLLVYASSLYTSKQTAKHQGLVLCPCAATGCTAQDVGPIRPGGAAVC